MRGGAYDFCVYITPDYTSLNIDVLLDDLLVIISEYWNHLLET